MREYNVVILGPQGAGKTVYLASLFHKLSTASDKIGYYLKTPLEDQKKLIGIFTGLAKQWPKPTGLDQTNEWHFDVMVRSKAGITYKALGLRYYDYAGGRLTDVTEKDLEAETQAILDSADVFIGLLDGEALYNELVLGKKDSNFWLQDVMGLCTIMNDFGGKSIHFIVSKWDLFEDSDDSLNRIKQRLLKFEPFENLVKIRSKQAGRTRVIPVSSVGYNFASLKNNKMELKGDGEIPKPTNVEWPFACILPDLIETEVKKAIEEAEKQARRLEAAVQPNLNWWDVLTGWIGQSIKTVNASLGLDDPILRWVAQKAQQSSKAKMIQAEEREQQNLEESRKLREEINNEQSALTFVINSMMSTADQVSWTYRSSNL